MGLMFLPCSNYPIFTIEYAKMYMTNESLIGLYRHEILRGFPKGGIGLHGTFVGHLNSIVERGILLPSELELTHIKDNVVAYYATPSAELIRQVIHAVGSDQAGK